MVAPHEWPTTTARDRPPGRRAPSAASEATVCGGEVGRCPAQKGGRLTVATLVERHDGQAGGDQVGHDEVPEAAGRGEAVQQQDRNALAGPDGGPQAYTVAGQVDVDAAGNRGAALTHSPQAGVARHPSTLVTLA